MTLFEYDAELGIPGFCGVDEAGRGPLAGDVYAAAVILSPDRPIPGINDSKKLSEKKREALFDEICEKAVSYSIATASIAEIDHVNILQATFLAMRRAVEGLSVKPSFALIDGDKNPNVSVSSRFLVGGDAKSASIAAASILAKVARDRYMKTLDQQYPDYQFGKHKGYGTKLHYEKLDEFGISPVHRKSFLKKYLAQKESSMFSTDGQLGENIAATHLEAAGCQILIRNYHSPYGEIDIIAMKDGFLLFLEVKTRSNEKFSTPREAVTPSKQQKICQTAAHFLVENSLDAQPRFDIIEVVGDPEGEVTINWFENAFTSKKFGKIV